MYTFKELISLYHKINENDIDYFNGWGVSEKI